MPAPETCVHTVKKFKIKFRSPVWWNKMVSRRADHALGNCLRPHHIAQGNAILSDTSTQSRKMGRKTLSALLFKNIAVKSCGNEFSALKLIIVSKGIFLTTNKWEQFLDSIMLFIRVFVNTYIDAAMVKTFITMHCASRSVAKIFAQF